MPVYNVIDLDFDTAVGYHYDTGHGDDPQFVNTAIDMQRVRVNRPYRRYSLCVNI